MKAILLAALLLATGSVINAQISVGIVIAPPPPTRVVVVVPERPAPEFVWVEGYWYPVGNHYKWHEGYWTRPPYEGARWVGPHHDGKRYYTVTGKEIAAVLSTTTTQTTTETMTEATTNMLSTTTTINSARQSHESPLITCDYQRDPKSPAEHLQQVSQIFRICIDALATGFASGSNYAVSTQGH